MEGQGYLWCAGHKFWGAATEGEAADVVRVEAIHILVLAHGIQHFLLADVLWEGQLHKHAMYPLVCVVVCNHLQNHALRHKNSRPQVL